MNNSQFMQEMALNEERRELIVAISDRYHSDAAFRDRIDRGDNNDVFDEFGMTRLEGIDYRFLMDSDEVAHFVMPPDPNSDLADEQLSQIAGGSCASTAGTIGSASTIVCFTSFSSLGSASTIGSAGSAG